MAIDVKCLALGLLAGYVVGVVLPLRASLMVGRTPRPPGMVGNSGVPEGPGFYRP